MESIKTAIKKTMVIQKKYLKIYQIILSDKQKIHIFGDEDYNDFQNRISKYGGKGLIYTKHGFVNPSFIVSISRDFQAERDIYEDFTQYGKSYEPPKADFQLPAVGSIEMLGIESKDNE